MPRLRVIYTCASTSSTIRASTRIYLYHGTANLRGKSGVHVHKNDEVDIDRRPPRDRLSYCTRVSGGGAGASCAVRCCWQLRLWPKENFRTNTSSKYQHYADYLNVKIGPGGETYFVAPPGDGPTAAALVMVLRLRLRHASRGG